MLEMEARYQIMAPMVKAAVTQVTAMKEYIREAMPQLQHNAALLQASSMALHKMQRRHERETRELAAAAGITLGPGAGDSDKDVEMS